ncbi:MAG: InlB B-repeat-containing protein [Candidatus Coproplasma sp.]
MNKYLKGLLCAGSVAAIVCGAGILGACGDNGTEKFTVSFETNGGSAVASQQVESGGHAVQPEDPTKTEYIFNGWYKDAELNTDYVFEDEVITADTTVYAGWLSASATDTATATFYYNYDGAPNGGVYETKEFADGGKLRKPADPKRDGYVFEGWYMDADCQTAFVNNGTYTGNQSIYAHWLKTYTFEAENTKITGFAPNEDYSVNGEGDKIGHGSSSDFSGLGLIGNDSAASGGKAVHGIYYEGAYLDFEFTSDKAENGVSLSIVIAAEFREITLTQNTFQILVNGTAISYKFGDITLDGSSYGDGVWDSGNPHAYQEVVINSVNIVEGKNVIRLYVNNSQAAPQGTCQAMAPIVDCIRLKSSSTLTMTVYENK